MGMRVCLCLPSRSVMSNSLQPQGLYIAHQAPLSMGIFQARILEWVAMTSYRRSSQPRDQTQVSHVAGRFFTDRATRENQDYWSGQPFPSPVYLPNSGIEPGSPALQMDSLPAELPREPIQRLVIIKWSVVFNKNVSGRNSSLTPEHEKHSGLTNLEHMNPTSSRESGVSDRWEHIVILWKLS